MSVLLRSEVVLNRPLTSLSVGTEATGRPEAEKAKTKFSRRRRVGLLGAIVDVTSGSTSLVAARPAPRACERATRSANGAVSVLFRSGWRSGRPRTSLKSGGAGSIGRPEADLAGGDENNHHRCHHRLDLCFVGGGPARPPRARETVTRVVNGAKFC